MTIDFSKALTKELILSKVSEEEIFARYGVPVESGMFRSYIRPDRRSTCMFYRRRGVGKLILRDYAGHFWGDCFDLVMKQERVNFGGALSKVASDFRLTDEVVLDSRVPAPSIYIPPADFCDIRVKRREWNSRDQAYWGRWHFKQETLDLFHIAPLERVWINDEQIYAYRTPGREAYGYYFGQYDYKIYFPWRDSGRFRHNNSWLLQGYLQLPASGEFVVITKSLKDVAKMYEFGVPAVAPMSESTLPSLAHMEELAERFGRIIVFYDNDWPGRRQMVKIRQKYGQQFLLDFVCLPQGYPKDFTDYYEQRGEKSTLSLIEHVKTELL